jgi:hypothetical protein
VIVSYNKREEVGDMAFIGPFQMFVELRTPEGARVQLFSSSTSRRRHEELLHAIRTMRMELRELHQ